MPPEAHWVNVEPLPGWEGFDVWICADLVAGEPRIIGLRLEPRPDARHSDVTLTANRLRTFPVSSIAAMTYYVAMGWRPETFEEAKAALDKAATELASKPTKGRAATTPQVVAELYVKARELGLPPRPYIKDHLRIVLRTVDRYIGEARRLGLIPPYGEDT